MGNIETHLRRHGKHAERYRRTGPPPYAYGTFNRKSETDALGNFRISIMTGRNLIGKPTSAEHPPIMFMTRWTPTKDAWAFTKTTPTTQTVTWYRNRTNLATDPPMMHLVEKQKIPYNIAIKYQPMPKAAHTTMTGWGIRLFTNTMPGATRSCIGRWRFDTRYGYDSVGNLVSGTRFREHALLHSTKALMDLGLETDLQHCKVG